MAGMKNVHTVLVGKPERKVSIERLILKHMLNKLGVLMWSEFIWYVVEFSGRLWVNICLLYKVQNFLTSSVTGNFSKRTLFHGAS